MSGPAEPDKVSIYTKKRWSESWSSKPLTATYRNPTELTFEKKLESPTASGNRRDTPVRSVPRPEAEKISLELFFDTTDAGTGAGATSVTALTDPFYALLKLDPDEHMPPFCLVVWGQSFPGSDLPGAPADGGGGGGQRRYGFVCVVEKIRQRFSLFSTKGLPLRATLTLTLAEYKGPSEEAADANQSSPDRTHAHVLRRGDALWQLASRYYRKPGEWRAIAEDPRNAIDDPRRLIPGRVMIVPAIR